MTPIKPCIHPPANFRMPSFLYYLQLLELGPRENRQYIKRDLSEMGYGAMSLVAAHYLGVDKKLLEVEPEKGYQATLLLEVLSGINIDKLSGDTIIEKAVSLAQLVIATDPLSELRYPSSRAMNDTRMKAAIVNARNSMIEAQEIVNDIKMGKMGEASELLTKGKTVESELAANMWKGLGTALKLLKTINKMTTISFETRYELEAHPYGPEYIERLGGLSDIHEIDPAEITLDRIEDLISGKFYYKKPAEKKTKKRIIFLGYDNSVSMSLQKRKAALFAFFIKLSKIEGLDLIAAAFFTDLWDIKICKTPKEIMEIIEKRPPHRSGNTDVNHVIEQIHSLIRNGIPGYHISPADIDHVEVFIVNDGEDKVGDKQLSFRTHAVSLHGENKELKKLCLASGGTYNSLSI